MLYFKQCYISKTYLEVRKQELLLATTPFQLLPYNCSLKYLVVNGRLSVIINMQIVFFWWYSCFYFSVEAYWVTQCLAGLTYNLLTIKAAEYLLCFLTFFICKNLLTQNKSVFSTLMPSKKSDFFTIKK